MTEIPPGYIRGPLSIQHRAKLSEAHRKRLKIPTGMCRIYGMLFAVQYRDELTKIGSMMRQKYGIATARAVLAIVYGRILSREVRKKK